MGSSENTMDYPYHLPRQQHQPMHRNANQAQPRSNSSDRTGTPTKILTDPSSILPPNHPINNNSSNNNQNTNSNSTATTPLFERLVTEEVAEFKTYTRIIENQSQRLSDLERIHDDLEARLEMETKARMELENLLEQSKESWHMEKLQLDREREELVKKVQEERNRNEHLLDQVYRKDKEIHRMIQRKYDNVKNSKHQHHSHGNYASGHHHAGLRRSNSSSRAHQLQRTNSSSNSTTGNNANNNSTPPQQQPFFSFPSSLKNKSSSSSHHNKSPYELLSANGSGEAVRERNVANSLLDFFGM